MICRCKKYMKCGWTFCMATSLQGGPSRGSEMLCAECPEKILSHTEKHITLQAQRPLLYRVMSMRIPRSKKWQKNSRASPRVKKITRKKRATRSRRQRLRLSLRKLIKHTFFLE